MERALRSVAAFALVSVVTPITCVIVIIGALVFLPLPATIPQPKPILESDVTHVLDKDGNEIAVFKHFETYIKVERPTSRRSSRTPSSRRRQALLRPRRRRRG